MHFADSVCLCVLLQAMALRLPTVTEVVDRIDEADPVLVWQVQLVLYSLAGCWVVCRRG